MVLKVLRSKKFAKIVFSAILILIIPAFIFWGVGTFAKRPALIGYIRKQKIYQDAFERSRQGVKVQLLLIYYGNYEALSQILKNQTMVNYMAWERLILLSEAKERKINISNNDVLGILSRHPLFQRNGIFSKEMYNYILRNTMYMEERQFEELVRENLKTHIIRQEILKNVSVSEEDIKNAYKKLNGKVELSYIILTKEEVGKLYDKINSKDVTLEKIAENTKQKIKTSGPISAKDSIEDGTIPVMELVLRAHDTQQGRVVLPVVTEKGVIIARVDNFLPVDESSLDAEKESLRKNLLTSKQVAAIENWFRENKENVKLVKPLEEL